VASEGCLTAVAHGDVEVEEGVLVIRRIHVVFTLTRTAAEQIESANRAHEVFRMKCPVYRSLHQAITITTELRIEPLPRA
jgi:uncharacterized OsmC-like protein